MSGFFSRMDEDYAAKHFPTGSVFDDALKTTKKRGVGGIFFSVLCLAGAVLGLIWSIGRTMGYITEGQDDMLSVGIVFCVIFGLAAIGFLALLCYLIKGITKKRDGYLADSAKHSKLAVSEIEAFDRQAMNPDTYILRLAEGLDRALSGGTNKDGLLTRDYIYLADTAQIVMRVDALKACCFSDYTYYISVGKSMKQVHCLAINLLAANGVSVYTDTTREAGLALMELLKERNGEIDTNHEAVLAEGEFDGYKKRILG